MVDLDNLRPEVRKALEVCDRDLPETWHSQTTQWGVIRAELLRLAEYEQAAGKLAIEKAEFRQRAERAEAELDALKNLQSELAAQVVRAEYAEAELAALKARMFRGIVLDVDDLARGHAGLPSEWRGKRVRLLVEE